MENERKVLCDLETAMLACFQSKEALSLPGREQAQLLITAAAMLIKATGGDAVMCLVSSALAIDADRTTELILRAAKSKRPSAQN